MIAANEISTNLTIPTLENGDKLTRDEFERRYQAMPDHQKAELIAGIVYNISLGAWKLSVFRPEMKSDSGGFNPREYFSNLSEKWV